MHPTFQRIACMAIASLCVSAHALTMGVTEGVTYKATDSEIEARFEGIEKAISVATKQPVKIVVYSKYNALRDALKSGAVDFAFIHPTHVALEAIQSGNYKAMAWTAGFTEYKVSLLCKEAAEPIKNWSSVSGKAMVMPDADSITSVMTRAMLKENGLKPADVRVQNTRYQDAVPFYVENNFSVYGATASNGVIKAWKEKGGKTCAESRAMPIKQWVVSSGLAPSTASAVRDALLGMEGAALGSSGYKKFVAPSSEQEKSLIAWLGIH